MNVTRLQRNTYLVWMSVGIALLLYAGYRLLARPLGVIVPPLLLAVLIVYLLNPVVSALERRGIPRWLGTGAAYALFLGLIVIVAAVVLPMLTTQLSNFSEFAPQLGSQLVDGVNGIFDRLGITARFDSSISGDSIAEEIQTFLSAQENRTALLAVLGGLSGLALGLVHLLIVFVVGPFIALYTLIDLPRLSAFARRTLPPAYRAEVAEVASRLGSVVGGFVRGQLLVATFVGLATSLGLWLIGLPFWLLVGIIAGITNLVPLIGPFVGGLVGVSIALVAEGPMLAILVVVVVTVVQQLDGHVISPIVVGRTVRLHPLVVLLALLVAGTLYGIFGLLVAVPLVAGVKVLAAHVWETRVPWARAGDPIPDAPQGAPQEDPQGASRDRSQDVDLDEPGRVADQGTATR